jgi:hypothetical protein
MSTSTQLNPSELLPPPPQTVAGGPNAVQRADMDSQQFKTLLNMIGGKHSRRRRRKSSKKSTKRRRYRTKRRKTRRSRRSLYRKKVGGNSIPVNVPPVPYNDTSYPSVTAITTKLAATTAQSNADSKLDAVGGR